MFPKQALAIGINTYTPTRLNLRPCLNDAADLSSSLRSIGFQVKNAYDTDLNTMKSVTHQFINSIQPGAVVVFYFSGHGVQCNGNNYLVPSDADGICSENINSTAIDAQKVVEAIHTKSPRLIICILDCCRTNPPDEPLDASPRRKALSGTRPGFAPIRAPPSTIVVYACAANDTASARSKNGRNSLYTYHLLRYIRTPNTDVEVILKRVAADVQQDSRNDQIPYRYSSCNEMICLASEPGFIKAPVVSPRHQRIRSSDREELFLFEIFANTFYENFQLERRGEHHPRQMPVPHILHPPQLVHKSASHSPNHHHHHQPSKDPYALVQKPSASPMPRHRPVPDLPLQPDLHHYYHHGHRHHGR